MPMAVASAAAVARCSRLVTPAAMLIVSVVMVVGYLDAAYHVAGVQHAGSAATAVQAAMTAKAAEAAARHRKLLQDASSSVSPSTATATAVQVGNSTLIVITPAPPPAAADARPAAPAPVQVLVCPIGGGGLPGCPTNTQSSQSNSQTNTLTQSNSTNDSQSNSSSSGSQVAISGPIVPENPKIDELPPKGIDMSKLKAPDTVFVNMVLPGVDAETFVSKYSGYVDNITATVSGTPAKTWNITVQQQQYSQQQFIRQGSRRLLQQQQQQEVLNVTLSLFAANPLIVWYRLTRTNAAANTTSNSSSTSSQSDGCSTQYCSKVVAAGVPLNTSSITVSPNYAVTLPTSTPSPAPPVVIKSVTNTSAAVKAVNDALLKGIEDNQTRRDTIRRVVGSVASVVIGLGLMALIWWKRKNIKRSLKRWCGSKTAQDAVKPVTSDSAETPAAAAVAGSNNSATAKASSSSKGKGSSRSPSRRRQGQRQQQQPSKDVANSGIPGDADDLAQNDDIQVPIEQLPSPRRRFASFEKRKYKAAAAAAAQSPITKPSSQIGQTVQSGQSSDGSVENADVSSIGSLGSSNVAGGGSSAAVQRQIRSLTPRRRGSDDGTVSEAGTVVTIQSAINRAA